MGFWKGDKQNNENQQALRRESLRQDLMHAQESQSLNKSPKQLSKEANQKQQADEDLSKCLFSELSQQNGSTPKPRNRPCKVRNLLESSEAVDTLHLQGDKYSCNETRCLGSIYMPPNEDKRYAGQMRSKEEMKKHAFEFLNEYYASSKQKGSKAHEERLEFVRNEINATGTYQILEDELIFGTKLAWRNAARCIGRIQWKKLKVYDARHVTTAREMFDFILEHVRYATNGGILRSAITIFPPRAAGRGDFRIWNSTLFKYAGYKQTDGSVIGDPGSVELTEIAQNLGWKGKGTPFDMMPIILQANGEEPEYFEYPEDDVMQVDIRHPTIKALNDLNLKWFAVPSAANMIFDCGGLEFTAAPFNGWYTAPEIGARNLTDLSRYNLMKPIAEAFGYDVSNNATLWKDKVMVELTVAVLDSYNKAGVTIYDHHTAAETFMKHMKDEEKLRGGCPADWVWIVPPISGSATPVFHQEMLSYHLRPSYEYQPDAWKDVPVEEALGTESLQSDLIQSQKAQSLNELPRPLSKEVNEKQEDHENKSICPYSGLSQQNEITPKPQNRPFIVKNLLDSSETVDTLHFQGDKYNCNETRCLGSVYMSTNEDKRYAGEMRSKEEIKKHAFKFLNEYYASSKQTSSKVHEERLKFVENEINATGTYQILEDELTYGAKLAWRNAPRCTGRIEWKNLKVYDARHVTTAKEMFDCILEHVRYATNGGNLRSTMTIFPPRAATRGDFRIWNNQLFKYAGYKQTDGNVIGDPASVELTEIAQKLGWKGKGTPFDIMPIILQANGEEPEYFEYPEMDVMEVDICHPTIKALNDLKLKWYAIPSAANMIFDCGGLEFTAAPFNGWYTAPEIGARNLTDLSRYNLMKPIAEAFGYDVSNNATLWKDKVMVELTAAVLDSYNKTGVTISDHHTAAETFIKHMKEEEKVRGGCPADWIWIVPPISASATPVFHQEMLLYHLRPSFEYQPDAWKDVHVEKKDIKVLRSELKSAFLAATFTSCLMKKALAKRNSVSILYATETGKSEKFAKKLHLLFSQVFDSKVECMLDYDFKKVTNEKFIIVLSSTFGNGEAPDNGKDFGKSLYKLLQQASLQKMHSDKLNQVSEVKEQKTIKKLLANVKYSVFALGSTAYPSFCEFGHTVDEIFKKLGGEEVYPIGEGDELNEQEASFKEWAQNCFKAACNLFGIEINEGHLAALGIKASKPWQPGKYRIVQSQKPKGKIIDVLSMIHKKKVYPNDVISVENLQTKESSRVTDLVRLKNHDTDDMKYSPGDHLCVYPLNNSKMVKELLSRCENSPNEDEVIEVQFDNGEWSALWTPLERLPMATTLTDIFTSYLDITSPPNSTLLSTLADNANALNERKALKNLAKGGDLYNDWKETYNPTILEVLQQFPSVKCDITMLIKELPILNPRYYSISSSPVLYPGEVHATVALVKYSIEGKDHEGVCSSYLDKLKPGDSVPCTIKKAQRFHLPQKPDPVIMIGPGTGIAPFRSFWQQKISENIENGTKTNDMTMFFGCRHPHHDNIYAKELQEAKDIGVLTNVFTAYSRHPNQPKKYVQDLLKENTNIVKNHIIDRNGHIYVCGDVNMAAEVRKTIQEILEHEQKLTKEDANTYMKELKNEGRYHEDIFGATHIKNKASRRSKGNSIRRNKGI